MYYRGNCTSSKKAIAWFKLRNIDVEMIHISSISRDDLIRILSLNDKGFDSILKRPGGRYQNTVYNEKVKKLGTLSFEEGLLYLKINISLIKTPIILDCDKSMVGYNSEEIFQFLPKGWKKSYSCL